MKYEELKEMLKRALDKEQLLGWDTHDEQLDLESMSRTHESLLGYVELGLADVEAGRVTPHEEVVAKMRRRFGGGTNE